MCRRVGSDDGTYRNNLGTDEREGSLCHDRPPAEETTGVSLDAVVLNERAGVLPVTETNAVVVRSSTEVKNDTEDNETDDGDDLDRGEDELRLAVDTSTEEIDDNNHDDEYCYPRGLVDGVVPETNEHSACTELSR